YLVPILTIGLRSASSPPLCAALHLFFFNDPPTTEIYTLSLHDALPISFPSAHSLESHLIALALAEIHPRHTRRMLVALADRIGRDRKSTRLNSSHVKISYAVFCLKKKREMRNDLTRSQRNSSAVGVTAI